MPFYRLLSAVATEFRGPFSAAYAPPDSAERASGPLWLPLLAPQRVLLVGVLTALLLVVADTLVLLKLPYFGITFASTPQGLRIAESHRPEAGQAVGKGVVAITNTTGTFLPIDDFNPHVEPHTLPDFAAYNAYLARHGEIQRILDGPDPELLLADGSRLKAFQEGLRKVASLPLDYWLFHLFGLIALVISLGVWSFRRGEAATRLLALSGIGFFAATLTNAFFLARELVLPQPLLHGLAIANHVALYLMIWALVSILCYYPRRLIPSWVPLLFGLLMALNLIGESQQLWQWPVHTFYMPVVFYWLFGVSLAVIQWRGARNHPLERAAFKWFILSIALSTGLSVAVYFAPLLFDDRPLLSNSAQVGFASTLYLGLALGILRFRLFELERWWFESWLWLLGGVAVVVVDAAVAFLLGVKPLMAVGVALLLVGWFYFPLRQWAWRQFTDRGQHSAEHLLPEVVEALFSDSGSNVDRQWQALLERVFRPLAVGSVEVDIAAPCVTEHGSRLLAPRLSGDGALELVFAHQGNRLFGPRDLQLAAVMHRIARRAIEARQAQEAGARAERKRIIRDLHDDVGARILTLVHRAESDDNAELARAALVALRESLHTLDDRVHADLGDQLEEWQAELRERLRGYPCKLEWHQATVEPGVRLTPRQQVNLKRIIDEAVSNTVKHAQASRIVIRLVLERPHLRVCIENDGLDATTAESAIGTGRGLANIRTRAEELHGQANFRRKGHRFQVELSALVGDDLFVTGECPVT